MFSSELFDVFMAIFVAPLSTRINSKLENSLNLCKAAHVVSKIALMLNYTDGIYRWYLKCDYMHGDYGKRQQFGEG